MIRAKYVKSTAFEKKAVIDAIERLRDPKWSPADESEGTTDKVLDTFRRIMRRNLTDFELENVIDDLMDAVHVRLLNFRVQTHESATIALNGVNYFIAFKPINRLKKSGAIEIRLTSVDSNDSDGEDDEDETAVGLFEVLHLVNNVDRIPLRVLEAEDGVRRVRSYPADINICPTYQQLWAAMTLSNPMVEFVKGIVSPSAVETKSSLGTFLRHDLSAVQVLYAVADLLRDTGGNPSVANDIQETARKLEQERRAKAAATKVKKRRQPSVLNEEERAVYGSSAE